MTSGVYAIWCLTTRQVYVGSAVRIHKRWDDHLRALRAGRATHRLQAAWNKWGRNVFVFEVLEYCAPEALSEREAAFIIELGALGPGGFNVGRGRRGPADRRT